LDFHALTGPFFKGKQNLGMFSQSTCAHTHTHTQHTDRVLVYVCTQKEKESEEMSPNQVLPPQLHVKAVFIYDKLELAFVL
jgi:hypothetical protein